MKRAATLVFVIFLILLTSSCASAPNWTGTETEAGEFVWTQTLGIRFYINVILLGGLLVLLVTLFIRNIIHPVEKDASGKNYTTTDRLQGLGCLTLVLVFFGYLLWGNISKNIRTESYLINSERAEHYFYHQGKNDYVRSSIEWKDVASCKYISARDTEKWRQGTTVWEKGGANRNISLTDQNNQNGVSFSIEESTIDTSILGTLQLWIFGTNDTGFLAEDEARLKKALNKYLPENVKQKWSPQTKDYFLKQE
jgi:hypothetical protein